MVSRGSRNCSEKGLNWLATEARPADTVVIYFSGHGIQMMGSSYAGEYLCPVNASLEPLENIPLTMLSSVGLKTSLESIKAGQIFLVLDACRSGGIIESRFPQISARAGLSDQGYDQLAQAQNVALFASSGWHEDSYELEDMRNSLFTHHVLEGLHKQLAQTDGTVWMSKLLTDVYEGIRKRGLQTPYQNTVGGDFMIMTTKVQK
jgi:uncharacterized caspase-like protein